VSVSIYQFKCQGCGYPMEYRGPKPPTAEQQLCGTCARALEEMKPKKADVHVVTDAKARKALPVFSGFVKYFPDAMLAVAELSRIGNDQHNPGQPLHWAKEKSTDEHDALMRHLIDAGTIDTDGVRHSTKVAWRAMAALQREIDRERGSK